MKRVLWYSTFVVIAFLPARGVAELQITMTPQSDELRCAPEKSRLVKSGSEVSFPVIVSGIDPEGLGVRSKLSARLFQLSHHLKVPIETKIEIGGGKRLVNGEQEVNLLMPAVEQAADFELRFSLVDDSGQARHVSALALRAEPKDMFAGVRQWAQKNILIVRDRAGNLREFLSEQKIPFVESRYHVSHGPFDSRQMLRLDVAEDDQREIEYLQGERVVVFVNRSDDVPKIISKENEHRRVIHVEMKLFPHLLADLRRQEVLREVIELALGDE